MKGIILHGGHGTRLRPLTHTGPKQLLPIANKPMSQYCVESLKDAGITDIAIIIGGIGSDKVREFYGNGEKLGVKFTYFQQDHPKGISHAINLCKEFIGNEKFVVFLGDNIIQKSIKQYVDKFATSEESASLLLCEVPNPSSFGIAELYQEKIIKIIEKPKEPKSNLAVTGIYFLTPLIFDIIKNLKPSWRNELEITDALHQMLENKNKITYHMITDYWKDTGTPEDVLHANKEILEKIKGKFDGKKDNESIINENTIIGKGSVIKGNSKIFNSVIIGENCLIENAQIGPYSSLGDNSTIISSKIENSIIMENCEIKGNVSIKDSIIAKNSSIDSEKNKDKIFLLGEGTKITL
jgi:glucose-1-phosphate thymidylyltransferase